MLARATEAPASATILVVDDAPGNLDRLGRILAAAGYRVRKIPSGDLALASAKAEPPDLILLDIEMPGMSGYETCQRLKRDRATRELPIIFISTRRSAGDKVRAFSSGAVDYITKPFQSEEVLARVAIHLRLNALQRRLEAQNRELERLATTDPLTGLLNRRSFTESGLRYLAQSNRYSRPLSLILLDIDGFKGINDGYGHDVGDKVLTVVTKRIREQLRTVDLFARWGGEEFVVLNPETPIERSLRLAERLRQCLFVRPIEPAGIITASFGVATGDFGESFDNLIRRADQALLAAKEAGKNRVQRAEEERDYRLAN